MNTPRIPEVGSFPADLLTADLATQPVLVAYLRELAAIRRIPISVPLAFNALAYGFDLGARCYDLSLLDLDRLLTAAVGTVIDALPVGALVRLASGGAPQACEVVFRHAEHEALASDGTCPPWLSGAPAGATEPVETGTEYVEPVVLSNQVTLRERLVVDAAPLGAGQPDRLRRLVGRTLNEDGHLLVYASYAYAEQADLDDSRQYAAHLLRHRGDDLRRALAPLGPTCGVALAETLHATFDAITTLLDAAGLLRWRDLYLHPDVYEQWRVGESPTRTAEPADLEHFARGAARECLPVRRRFGIQRAAPRYLAIGPTLRAEVSEPSDPARPAPGLRGTQYATTLACAQMYLADWLTEHGGLVKVDAHDVHIRIDDAWQGGGVWRTCLSQPGDALDAVDLPLAHGWLTANDPLPAGIPRQRIGEPAATTTTVEVASNPPVDSQNDVTDDGPPSTAVPDAPAIDPINPVDPWNADEDQERADQVAPRDQWVDDSTLGWRLILRPRYTTGGTLPLTRKVADAMRSQFGKDAALALHFSHPGTDLVPQQRRQAVRFDGSRLCGVTWPEPMFIGMKLTASWSRDSFHIAVTSTALDDPVDVDGIPLDYEFDEAVVLRHLWGSEDPDADADALSPLVLRALLRRNGRRVDKSVLFVPLRELTAAIRAKAEASGEPTPTTAEVFEAVEALRASTADGAVRIEWGILLTRDDGLDGQWLAPRRPCPPQPEFANEPDLRLGPGDPAILLSLHPTPADRMGKRPAFDSGLPRDGDEFLRRGHLRRLPRGQTPQQRELAIAYATKMGWDPRTLHPRVTFVHESTVQL